MAALHGPVQVFDADTTTVDSTLRHKLGARARTEDGNEYIYLQGVASVVLGDWVTYDEAHLCTRVSANGVGPLAIAQAAVVASRYGWFLIHGYTASAGAISGGGCAADVAVYLTATAGLVDDVDVAGDAIIGALSRVSESSALIGVQVSYPFVQNIALD